MGFNYLESPCNLTRPFHLGYYGAIAWHEHIFCVKNLNDLESSHRPAWFSPWSLGSNCLTWLWWLLVVGSTGQTIPPAKCRGHFECSWKGDWCKRDGDNAQVCVQCSSCMVNSSPHTLYTLFLKLKRRAVSFFRTLNEYVLKLALYSM